MLLEHAGICDYFTQIFESDWSTALKQLPGVEPETVAPETLRSGKFIRVEPGDYREFDRGNVPASPFACWVLPVIPMPPTLRIMSPHGRYPQGGSLIPMYERQTVARTAPWACVAVAIVLPLFSVGRWFGFVALPPLFFLYLISEQPGIWHSSKLLRAFSTATLTKADGEPRWAACAPNGVQSRRHSPCQEIDW